MGELTELINEIWSSVEDSELPASMRESAFTTVLESKLGSSSTQSPIVPPAAVVTGGTPTDNLATESGSLVSLARQIDLPIETVSEVYSVRDDGTLDFHFQVGKLPSGKASGAREIAILVAAGRQGTGTEEWTKAGDIRQVCDYYSKFDQANFAANITNKSMQQLIKISGTGPRRQLQMRATGWREAKNLIEKHANVE